MFYPPAHCLISIPSKRRTGRRGSAEHRCLRASKRPSGAEPARLTGTSHHAAAKRTIAGRGNGGRQKRLGRFSLDHENRAAHFIPDLAAGLERPAEPPRFPAGAGHGSAEPADHGGSAPDHRNARQHLWRHCRNGRAAVYHCPDDAHGHFSADGPQPDPGGNHPGQIRSSPAESNPFPHQRRRDNGGAGRALSG